MPPWRLRDFHDDDLDQAIPFGTTVAGPVSRLRSFRSRGGVGRQVGAAGGVAVVGDELVGHGRGAVHGERLDLDDRSERRWRNRGIGSALLGELELRLRSLVCGGSAHCCRTTPRVRPRCAIPATPSATELAYFEKVDPVGASDAGLLADLGGQGDAARPVAGDGGMEG